MTTIVEVYRGCNIVFYEGGVDAIRDLWGSPCISGLYDSIGRVRDLIDDSKEEPPPAPPRTCEQVYNQIDGAYDDYSQGRISESVWSSILTTLQAELVDLGCPPWEGPDMPPPDDYIAYTYRDIDIWWDVTYSRYYAHVALGYNVQANTRPEIEAQIDEILELLEPPEDPPTGLLAQIINNVKTWFIANIQSWVEAWGQIINNVTNYIDDSVNYWGDQITQYIDNTVTYWTEEITNVYNTFREYVTNTYNYWTEEITNIYNTINEYVTNVTENIYNSVVNNTYNTIQNITNIIGVLDPFGFLSDPQGYITGVWNMLIDPWAHSMIESFWKGLDEGLEE